MYFEKYQDSKGEWRWTLYASNGKKVADFQGRSAEGGVEIDLRNFRYLAVSRCDHDVRLLRNRPVEIAIERQAREREEAEGNRQPPDAVGRETEGDCERAQDQNGNPEGPAIQGEKKLWRMSTAFAHAGDYRERAQGLQSLGFVRASQTRSTRSATINFLQRGSPSR